MEEQKNKSPEIENKDDKAVKPEKSSSNKNKKKRVAPDQTVRGKISKFIKKTPKKTLVIGGSVIGAILVIALVIGIAGLAGLLSDKEYPVVDSTEEEAKTVMTLSIDGDTYDVKYELYRAFFLTYKNEVDGGHDAVWHGDDKDKYIEQIDEIIIDRVTEIYSAFAICKRIGFDIYSDSVESKIKENIRISVEGGSYGSSTIEGYDSYEAYLEALKSMNLNYSVQTLLFRYAIAIDAIDTYYIGTASSDDVDINLSVGVLEYTEDDVRSFYNSDNCVRVLRASFQKGIYYTPLEKAYELKDKIASAANGASTLADKERAVFNSIVSSNLYANINELQNGYIIGRYNLERSYYGNMTDAAFTLAEGQVSDPIDVVTDVENSYYILYRTYKSDDHFENNYDEIKYIYLMNCVGKITYDVASELESSLSYTEFLQNINHSEIRM